jgi:hypothetical protein
MMKAVDAQFHHNEKGYFKKPNNSKFIDHAKGRRTLYYTGSVAGGLTLVLIDIDVLKALGLGSVSGGNAFARYLRRHFWKNLYIEESTNGRGVHCYLLLDTDGTDAEKVNAFLRDLQAWLREVARRINADIEGVEVKGTLPVIKYAVDCWTGYGKKKIDSLRFGQMAKLPRQHDRIDEIKNTDVLRLGELPELPSLPQAAISLASPALRSATERVKRTGISGSLSLISDDALARLPHYRRVAGRLLGGELLHGGRHLVTVEDFAISFLLLAFFKEHPKDNGALPTASIRGLWNALFQAGKVDRPFQCRRWKIIRDSLSSWGRLDWTDNRYCPRQENGGKGVAMKWSITEDFARELSSEGTGERESIPVNTPVLFDPHYLRPRLDWSLLRPWKVVPDTKLDDWIRWAETELSIREWRMAA